MKCYKKRILSVLLALALVLLLPVQAQAAPGPVVTANPTSLTIQYLVGAKTPAPGVRFDVYRVADVSADGTFTLVEELAGYRAYISLEIQDTEGWEKLVSTLLPYAQKYVAPQTGTTNQSGLLTFSGLKTGLYLVVGGSCVIGGKTYTAEPFLISLPDANETGTQWRYDVTVNPKYTSAPTDPGDKTVDIRVRKAWNDAGNAGSRPDSVKVTLLRNGQAYQTVTLNAAGNWRYTWQDLDAAAQWTVMEQPVPGYTMSVSKTVSGGDIIFLVTNTGKPNDPNGPDTPNNPDDPDNPDNPNHPDNPDNPDNPNHPDLPNTPDNPNNPSNPNPPSDTKLPQTGVLWWPVPVLLAAGLVLLIVGCVRRRENDAE